MFSEDSNKKYIVYMAISPSGKKYIGYTSQGLHKRRKRHWELAKKGVITRFYSALVKYSLSAFDWVILSESSSKTEILQMEQMWIKYYETCDKSFGYNMTPGGTGGNVSDPDSESKRIVKLKKFYSSDEQRKIQSEKNKKWSRNPENSVIMAQCRGGRPFVCIETGVIYYNICAAAREFGGCRQNLSAHLKGKRVSYKGFHFEYKTEI